VKRKIDEENFDEALAQAYRSWTTTGVPSDIQSLFEDAKSPSSKPGAPVALTKDSPIFYHFLDALRRFTEKEGFLPLSSTLPDMKANTEAYIGLQRLYKTRADEEKAIVKGLVEESWGSLDKEADGMLDLFVRNAHGVKVMRGKRWGSLEESEDSLGMCNTIL